MPLVLLAEEAEGPSLMPPGLQFAAGLLLKSRPKPARAAALTSLSDLDRLWVGDSGSGPGFRPSGSSIMQSSSSIRDRERERERERGDLCCSESHLRSPTASSAEPGSRGVRLQALQRVGHVWSVRSQLFFLSRVHSRSEAVLRVIKSGSPDLPIQTPNRPQKKLKKSELRPECTTLVHT